MYSGLKCSSLDVQDCLTSRAQCQSMECINFLSMSLGVMVTGARLLLPLYSQLYVFSLLETGPLAHILDSRILLCPRSWYAILVIKCCFSDRSLVTLCAGHSNTLSEQHYVDGEICCVISGSLGLHSLTLFAFIGPSGLIAGCVGLCGGGSNTQ